MSTDTPTAAELNEEFRQLRAAMAADGLGPAGHKRAAELILATYGDEFSQFDLAAGQIHATLAGGGAVEVAQMQAELAEAQKARDNAAEEIRTMDRVAGDLDAELEKARAKLADAEARAASVRDAYYREGERAEAFAARAAQARLDRNRYRAQTRAVQELCEAMRQEGLPGIARRFEAAMLDADIKVAKQHATVPRSPDGRVLPPPGPIELVADREWLIEQGSKITADECARCGNQIVRGQFDDGPWTHTETDSPTCRKSGGATTAMPKTYADLVGQRVVVLHDNGVRSHGFLRATVGDLLCLDDVDETVGNAGIDLRAGEVANVAATGPRRDQARAEGSLVLETAEGLIGQRVRIRKAGGCGGGDIWQLTGIQNGSLQVTDPLDGDGDEIPLDQVKTIEPQPASNPEDGR
ncbi:hypothetical protein [Actinomadura bangladeshensis]|uniref:Uncharacterized protein n=1 Tax=Actinomadura bangladeshensis TaxID=453573 RepID=A0A6L9QC49_9ACTN|nr:hypothetical protein [Actinomadura bangladeshensis]NEA22638.1 hypothetical protein [Actinomadura bangladeshensis]